MVAANLLAAAAPQTGGRTVNIACGDRISLNDLFARLRTLVGSELSPIHGPARAGDVKHSQADIAAAGKLIGFRPEVGLDEGLRETVAWYRAQGV